ncbi:MAG: hypothetical protein IPJ00_20245 [Saprospirales bacterium]|nr:hypothetical protein [Saprospirales bacterium]
MPWYEFKASVALVAGMVLYILLALLLLVLGSLLQLGHDGIALRPRRSQRLVWALVQEPLEAGESLARNPVAQPAGESGVAKTAN